MEFEVQPEAPLRFRIADHGKHAQERLGRGDMRRGIVVTQPIAARPGCWQPHAPAHPLDGPLHLSGFPPCAVEQHDLWWQSAGVGDICRGDRLALGMEDPRLTIGQEVCRRHAGACKEPVSTLVGVTPRSFHGACDQPARARRLVLLMAMDQHVHLEAGGHQGDRVADAPSRLLAAAWAAGRTGENDASWHALSLVLPLPE